MSGGIRIKIGDDKFETLNDIFTNQREFGPFVKGSDPNDLKLALMMMSKGTEVSSKLNKEHLNNIVKAFLMHLRLAEKVEVEIEDDQSNSIQPEIKEMAEENVIEDNQSDKSGEKSEPAKNIKQEKKNLQNVCNFYRAGKCIYGMSGKNRDKRGNICPYEHPEICKKYKMFEDTEKGCQSNDCNKMHVKHCKYYNKCKDYKAGHNDNNNCRFYHPKKKQKLQVKGNNQTSFQPKEENRYLQENKRKFECNNCVSSENKDFLGQKYPSQISSWVWENQSQAHQYKQPFTGPEKMQEQNKLNQMKGMLKSMEMLFHQAKSTMLC
jgi:hypothetical protein